jgi:hypothetical protein
MRQRQLKIVGLRSWLVAGAAALFGWLFALVIAAIVPGGWALLCGGVFALVLAALYARATRLRPLRVAALAFVCITLEWPVLFLVSLAIAYWVGGPPQD